MENALTILYQQFENLARGLVRAAPKVMIALVVFTAFLLIARFAGGFVERMIRNRGRGKFHATAMLLGRFSRVGTICFGLLVALSIVLPTFKASDLISFLGVGGVAVGFAFRDILQNFFAGIIIISSHVFDEGDAITSGEISGTVQEIMLRSTRIRTDTGQLIVVPNALLINREIRLTNAFETARSEIEIPLRLSDDLRAAQAMIRKVLAQQTDIGKTPAPNVVVSRMTEQRAFLKAWWWLPRKGVDGDAIKTAVVGEILTGINELRKSSHARTKLPLPSALPPIRGAARDAQAE